MFQSLPEYVIAEFRGSAQARDPYSLDPSHGLYSQNCDFLVGPDGAAQCMSRRGYAQISQIPNADGAVRSLFAWYFNNAGTQDCWAVYYAPSAGAKAWKQVSAAFGALVATTGAAYLSFVPDGIRGYFAFGDSTGQTGTTGGDVMNAATGNVDVLLTVPPSASGLLRIPSTSTPSAGVITQGNHNIGVQITTRNGQIQAMWPSSGNGAAFTAITIVQADGVHNLTINLEWGFSVSIPAYLQGGTAQIAWTTVANPNRYFLVPGATATIPSSHNTTAITFNISDDQLVLGTDITQSVNLLNGTPAFLPSALFHYSNRLCYVTRDASGFPVVYISDQNAYQTLTAAFSGIYLEGRQIPIQGCSIGGVCYIATLSGLYATSDNGGQPATWTPPARVDGSVGILAPPCIQESAGRILIASEKGLFSYRGGSFPQIPLSYWQAPDWNRINWAAPTQVQIVDDALERVIRVLAPLTVQVTGATNANPIVITTGVLVNGAVQALPHLLQTGSSVTIAGVTGNTNANGTFTITVVSATTFSVSAAGNAAYTDGGVVTPNSPNAEMSWNYSLGESPSQLFYSLNAFTSYRPGAIGTIRNIGNGYDETWYAPSHSNTGGIVRRVFPTDALIHRDVDLAGTAAAINTIYETGLVPGVSDQQATVHDYHAAHFRVSGSGNMAVTVWGSDHQVSTVPAASPIALATQPGLETLMRWYLRNEAASIQFGINAVDSFLIMALIRAYWTPSLPFR